MAQYGWQNTVACVGKWLRSNVWNRLSSGRVWKMTVLCILQKSLLIDFIYFRGRGHGDWWWGQLEERKNRVDSLHYPDILLWLGLLAPLKETGPLWAAPYFPLLFFLLLTVLLLVSGSQWVKSCRLCLPPSPPWHWPFPDSTGYIWGITCKRRMSRTSYRSL